MSNPKDPENDIPKNNEQPAQLVPTVKEAAATPAEQSVPSVFPPPQWWSFLIIGVTMIFILIGINAITMWFAKGKGKDLTSELRLVETLAKPSAASPANATPPESTKSCPIDCKFVADAALQGYVGNQRSELVRLGNGNLETAIEFGAYFYTNMVILAVFGLISLISLIVMTRYGLKDTNGHVVAIFLLSTGIGLVYQTFFGVFQQRKNVEVNLAQSISYGQLVKQIDTYCVTGKVAISDPASSLTAVAQSSAPVKAPAVGAATPASAANSPSTGSQAPKSPPPFYVALEPADFILYIDARMRENQRLSISFDDKAVSSFTDSSRLTRF